MRKNKEEITLIDIVNVFSKKLGIILIVAVLLSAMFGAYSGLFIKDAYTSTSKMYVLKDSMSPSSADLTTAEDMVEVYRIVLMSDDLLVKVVNKIPEEYNSYGVTVGFLKSAISLNSLSRGMFTISVTTGNSELSFVLACIVQDVAIMEMERLVNSFQILSIQEPKQAKMPNDKGVVTNALLGFAIGAAATMIVIWVVHAFDVVIRDKKKIEDNFDIPVLGVIPSNNLAGDTSEEGV